MTPAESDLRDFPHTPLFRSRLFGSSFHAQANDGEWRAGVTLWLKSWDQVPAGSLPNNEVELCRLAELARDLKTWKKLRDGALRGWVLCTDGRLYHPVVSEGVNTALEAKIKQRLKTAKARIAALEKHLAQAQSEDDKARITDEIEKLKQMLSQGLSQTLSQGPREEKEKEKEKGLDSSEAKASGGKPPSPSAPVTPRAATPAKSLSPAEQEKASLWAWLKARLVEQETSPDAKAAGVLAGGLATKYGNDVFVESVRAAMDAEPGNVHTYLIALCQTAAGKRVPLGKPGHMTDEQREAANAAATEEAMRRLRAGRAGGDVIDAEATEIHDHLSLETSHGH